MPLDARARQIFQYFKVNDVGKKEKKGGGGKGALISPTHAHGSATARARLTHCLVHLCLSLFTHSQHLTLGQQL